MLVDSHCHLDRLDGVAVADDLRPFLERAREQGVMRHLCVGTDLARWGTMMALVAPFDNVYASAGVHPLSEEIHRLDRDRLAAMVNHSRVIAIGETGLDYHYASDSRQAQLAAFRYQLDLAEVTGKPVIIHTRDAREDTLALLRERTPGRLRGVLHCFTEDLAMAEQLLSLGLYISFSGIISFRNAQPLRDVVDATPLDRMLVETDAPYLTPAPFRGKTNEPCYTKRVAEVVAEIKGVEFAEVAKATTANFESLFFNQPD